MRPLWVETAMTTGAFFGTLWLDGPERCRWCVPPLLDTDVRAFMHSDNWRLPHVLSYGTLVAAGLVGVGGLGLESWSEGRGSGEALENTLMIANAALLTTAITNAVKVWVGRQRPWGFYSNVTGPSDITRPETNVSFFSGHTSLAFSLAASATTVAYLRGYSWARYVAIISSALATATGSLRLVADAHWTTDVLAGAAAGTIVGIGLPLLLHSREN